MAFREIPAAELELAPFTCFDKDWALVMAGDSPEGANAMTVSWGGVGTLWSKPCATVYIRQSRYTKGFMDANGTFTVTFLPESLRDAHKVFGSKSGRDTNKTEATGLTPVMVDGVPTYAEAKTVLVCRTALRQFLSPEGFLDAGADARWYRGGVNEYNYHTMYVGYVEKVLVQE